jgi:hypothetical protein
MRIKVKLKNLLSSSHLDMFAFRRGATNAHHPQELVDILRKEGKKLKAIPVL